MNFMPRTLESLARHVDGAHVEGDPSLVVSQVATIGDAGPGTITWLRPGRPDAAAMVAACRATCIVLHHAEQVEPNATQAFIRCANPRLAFVQIVRSIVDCSPPWGIHPTAIISPDAVISDRVVIGPYCVIDTCQIGDGCVLDSHVRIHAGTRIGRRVRVAAGAVIGGDGYGYVRDDHGAFLHFPHLGHVEIGDDVDIGANTCIDRGTLGVTRIGAGAKIDNLVHVGHNVSIGAGAMIVAHAVIGGSTVVGDGAWLAPGAMISDDLTIGAMAHVGLGAVIARPVPEGQRWFGNPARALPPEPSR